MSLPRPLLLSTLLITALLLPHAAADVPTRSASELHDSADTVIVGPVLHHYTERRGRSEHHLTIIRTVRVEKGDARPGDEVAVRTMRVSDPASRTAGHRPATGPLGETVRAHIRTGDAILPNGLATAEPLYVTVAVLQSDSADTIRQAATRAADAGAHLEAIEAWRHLRRSDKATSADRLRLATSLFAVGEYADAAGTLRPLETFDPTEQPAAQRLLLSALWHAGDDGAYIDALLAIADQTHDASLRARARRHAEHIGDAQRARRAAEAPVPPAPR